jgi:uncharacterized protein
MKMEIRDATAADHAAILRLNLESERYLSALHAEKLRQLHAMASHCRVGVQEGEVMAFLLVFREGAAYQSENYRWFADRYPRFLYVDRIVVDERVQGRGWGPALYDDLFSIAVRSDVDIVTCEYDVEPPNAQSERFHARFGFTEVGSQRVSYGGNKRVSLQAAHVLK